MVKTNTVAYCIKAGLFTLLICLTACSTIESDIQQFMADEAKEQLPLQVYLVRHAEKELNVKNPPLSPEGQTRSIELMRYLANIPLDTIYSTDYQRTLETAEPIATLLRKNIEHYDPRDLSAFADELKAQFGVILVVGHSNTTPQLVELLGGDSVSEINEASEYDRLYHVFFEDDGTVQSKLLRYGKPYQQL